MRNRYLLAIAAACAAVIVTTESQAQQVRGQVINNTINNSYNGNYGYGWNQPNRTYNYNCTGCYAGSGPYDSAIATSGIGAAAGIIGMLIQNSRPVQPPAPPQVVVVVPQQPQSTVITTQPFPVRQAPVFNYGR